MRTDALCAIFERWYKPSWRGRPKSPCLCKYAPFFQLSKRKKMVADNWLCDTTTVCWVVHLVRNWTTILGGDDDDTLTCIIHRLCHCSWFLPLVRARNARGYIVADNRLPHPIHFETLAHLYHWTSDCESCYTWRQWVYLFVVAVSPASLHSVQTTSWWLKIHNHRPIIDFICRHLSRACTGDDGEQYLRLSGNVLVVYVISNDILLKPIRPLVERIGWPIIDFYSSPLRLGVGLCVIIMYS